MDKVNFEEKLGQIKEYWDPHIAAELNGQQIKLAKIKGSFVWHSHEQEDEMFLVLKGQMRMHLRDKTIVVNQNEFIIVPKGIEHMPEAEEEVHLMLFEPAGTINTGEVVNDKTKKDLKRI
jgi:mannose-6-phosphate isomerase-like protein (cupin superfamily)